MSEVTSIATTGVMMPEAVEAAQRLSTEGIAANVFHITSPQKLFALFTESCHHRLNNPMMIGLRAHLETLFSPEDLYRYAGISVDDIVSAGYEAWESGEDASFLC